MKTKKIKIILFFIQLSILCSCNNYENGSLGNNLYFWGDNNKSYQIVFCDTIDISGDLKRCSKIIPYNELIYDFSEHVDSYAKNNEWIIVKTNYIKYGKQNHNINLPIDTVYKRYWIIDKSFNPKISTSETIANSNLIGPMDSVAFNSYLKVKNIKLKLTKPR